MWLTIISPQKLDCERMGLAWEVSSVSCHHSFFWVQIVATGVESWYLFVGLVTCVLCSFVLPELNFSWLSMFRLYQFSYKNCECILILQYFPLRVYSLWRRYHVLPSIMHEVHLHCSLPVDINADVKYPYFYTSCLAVEVVSKFDAKILLYFLKEYDLNVFRYKWKDNYVFNNYIHKNTHWSFCWNIPLLLSPNYIVWLDGSPRPPWH